MIEYIYAITSLKTSKVYIGRTCNIASRRNAHFSYLARGAHINKNLQSEYTLYGRDNLVFEVIDSCADSESGLLEEYYISQYDDEMLLNAHNRGTGGRHLTEEQLIARSTRCFEALDKGYEDGIGLKRLAVEYRIAINTLVKYMPMWEDQRGVKYEHPQSKITKENIEKFVKDYEENSELTIANRDAYMVSHQSFAKYLPDYGLTLEDVYKTKWREESIEKARLAYEYKVENRCTVMEAIRHTGANPTTLYKYIDEWRANDSRPFNSEEVAKCVILEMIDGMSMNKACKAWRISKDTVKKYCPEWVKYKG